MMTPPSESFLEITLQSNQYLVKKLFSAREGLIMAANHPPDLSYLILVCLMKMDISYLKSCVNGIPTLLLFFLCKKGVKNI